MFNKFPYTDNNQLNLDWFLEKFKELYDSWVQFKAETEQEIDDFETAMTNDFNDLLTQFEDFKTYVTTYLDNLDYAGVVADYLEQMVDNGTFLDLIHPTITSEITSWLNENVTPVGSAVMVDYSLTISGAAADAKTTGEIRTALCDNEDLYIPAPQLYNGGISTSTGKWFIRTDRHYIILDALPEVDFKIGGNLTSLAFLKSYTTPIEGETPNYCDGTTVIFRYLHSDENGVIAGKTPSDCNYIYLSGASITDTTEFSPLIINGYDYSKTVKDNIKQLRIYTNDQDETFTSYDAVNTIMNIAETYLNAAYDPNNLLIYRSEHGLYSNPFEDGIKAIVCSQFSQACIAGIAYNNSRFVLGADAHNKPYWWGFVSDGSGDYSHLHSTGDSEPGDSDNPDDYGPITIPDEWYEYGPDYMSANEQYEYFRSKGIVHDFDIDHNDIKAGDLLFYLASTWNHDLRDTDEDYVSHVVIALRPYRKDLYTIIHSNSGWRRLIDNEEVGVITQEWKYSTTKPSYYVHLADIPIMQTITKSKLIKELYWNVSGNIPTTAPTIQKIGEINFIDTLPSGLYTINSMTSDDCDWYARVIYENGNQVNYHGESIAGITSIVFYAQMPFKSVHIYANNGTTYSIESSRMYKGYHSQDY